MSVARQTKNELVRVKIHQPCCSKAELMAMLHMRGSLTKSGENIHLEVTTENTATARRFFQLFKGVFKFSPELLFHHKSSLQKNKVFILRFSDKEKIPQILNELGFSLHTQGVEWRNLRRRCCRRAYARGAFLASGSLINPKVAYHLEINCPYHHYAQLLKEVLVSFQLQAKSFKRKNDFVVYFKGSEQIVEFLRIIEAHNTLLNFENVRIIKGMRSQINRLVNCDTANMEKTVIAAQKQIENINTIERLIGLENIPPVLRRTVELRRLHPEASLKELGEMFDPPVGKSGINHRLRRINALAKKLKPR